MLFQDSIIHEVIIPGDGIYTSGTKTPPKDALFNFELKAKRGKMAMSWVILENHGNITLTRTITDRVFGPGTFRHGYYLAINPKTGRICTAHFGRDQTINFVTLSPVDCRNVPKPFLAHLEELNGSQRPFCLMLSENTYRDLLDREIGYGDLKAQLVIELHFNKKSLQICGDSYRTVGDWT